MHTRTLPRTWDQFADPLFEETGSIPHTDDRPGWNRLVDEVARLEDLHNALAGKEDTKSRAARAYVRAALTARQCLLKQIDVA